MEQTRHKTETRRQSPSVCLLSFIEIQWQLLLLLWHVFFFFEYQRVIIETE